MRVLFVVVPVAVGGAIVTVAAALQVAASPSASVAAAALAGLLAAVLAEAFPVPIEGVGVGKTSLALVFVVAVGVVAGWAAAVLVAVLAMLLVEAWRRRPLSRVLFNTGLYALAAATAGAATAAVPADGTAGLVAGTVVGSLGFYAANICLLSGVVSLAQGEPLLPLAKRYVASTVLPLAVMGALAVVVVLLWMLSPLLTVTLAAPVVTIVVYARRMSAAIEQLRGLDRLKDEFVATVSHELRTPLASVYGAAATLRARELDGETQDSLLGVIACEGERLAGIIDEILLVSQLESGRVETVIEELDAQQLVAQAVKAAQARAPENIRFRLLCPPTLPTVSADGARVGQVLTNLLENAVKYSPDGGRIEVGAAATDGAVRFFVADEGLGIPASEQERVFEKFHRLDPNMTRGVGGTGLGLHICQQLIRHMNGAIWVSAQPGAGSTFSFELPAYTHPAHPTSITTKQTPHPQEKRSPVVAAHPQ